MDGNDIDPWMACMRRGDFEGAWRVSDALRPLVTDQEWRRPRHLQRVWRGQPLRGQRVLIRCYRGLGDSLQFVRYVPMVGATARDVTLWIQPSLIPLVEGMPGLDRVLPLHDGVPQVEADVDVEVMELPYIFRTTLNTIPSRVPYLRAPAYRNRPSARPRIGLAWRSGEWDDRRSLPVEQAARLMSGLDCDVEVLQQALLPHETRHFRLPRPRTLVEIAARMADIDLVITVDTVFAHLAGAFGRPVWLLLNADPNWRWMEHRRDSPWYRTARLFRQPQEGDWDAVAGAVRHELEGWLDEHTPEVWPPRWGRRPNPDPPSDLGPPSHRMA